MILRDLPLTSFNSAGSRDSPLTNHGVLQAKRLGAHLATLPGDIGPVKSIFSSNLQRAYRTAEAVAEAIARPQPSVNDSSETQTPLNVVQLVELREKDFGSTEGKKFGSRAAESDGDARSDAETRDVMKTRIERFIDVHLAPILDRHVSEKVTVVVVAHGIILGVLLRTLLSQYPAQQSDSLYQHGEVVATWSNTGVVQVKMEPATKCKPSSLADSSVDPLEPQQDLRAVIDFINNVDHLQGLKKTRGGIGSAKFDSKQRTMDSFFGPAAKKRKLGER